MKYGKLQEILGCAFDAGWSGCADQLNQHGDERDRRLDQLARRDAYIHRELDLLMRDCDVL